MDGTGCKQPFPASELQVPILLFKCLYITLTGAAPLQKCLDIRTYDLWQKIVQAEDIAAAELRGFEYCPACDFGMIFEVGHDVAPLLKCLKSDCRLVTCRRCGKPVMHASSNTLFRKYHSFFNHRITLVDSARMRRMLS